MKGYLMGVVCAAFLCALIHAIGAEGPGQGTRKLIAGVFLTLAVLSPLGSLDLPELSLEQYRTDAEAAVRSGTAQAEEAKNDIITDACEAYILSKAAELGLELDVHVTLDDGGLPCAVTLTGPASPAERERLSGVIARDFGLGKEAQTWNTSYQSSE